MRHGPKSDAPLNDPRVTIPAGLPEDPRVRHPLVRLISRVVQAAAMLFMVAVAGGAFALGVAIATRWMQ